MKRKTRFELSRAKKTATNPTTWQAVFLLTTVYFAIVEGLL